MAVWAASGGVQAAPAWENGGQSYEVSDLKSVVVDAQSALADGQPPLPPEPVMPEELGMSAPDEVVIEDDAVVPAPAMSMGERLQEFVPSAPDMMTFDSAVAIGPDGTIEPCSTKRGVLDCLDCFQDACWVVRFEALALWRNAPSNRPIFTTLNQNTQTTGATVFNANQLQSDPLAAPRLTIARLDECGRGFDASYLYAGNFYAQQSLASGANGYVAAAPGIYGNSFSGKTISSAQQQLIGSLQSAEINYREPLGWGATRFLTGFRWLQWRENWSMVDQFSDSTDPTITGTDNWQTNCLNNLYGGQIGLDTMLWNSGKGMRLEGLVKGGAYYNAATQTSTYSTSGPTAFADGIPANSPAGCAFVGEVGLTGVVPLRKNLDLRCGYFGLWLSGLAQPTRQLSGQVITPSAPLTGSLTTNGALVLQGVSLGLEGRW